MKRRQTKADLERDVASLRSQVEMLQAMNQKLVDALTHAATHPYVPCVQPPAVFGPVVPLRVEPPYIGDPVPSRYPFIWCGNNTTGCATLMTSADAVPSDPLAMAFS